jgi:LPPG:FO 2-phospho-L-lactate transferase
MSKVVVITGGVGGAKLALGLQAILAPGDLFAIVNTGDDFEHLGFAISPDIDTLTYTLAGKAHRANGWGREDESWNFMAALRELGGEDWFSLGDRDLALHAMRTQHLRAGRTLSDITAAIARSFAIPTHILPMSDQRVSTIVDTPDGALPFQHYFVRDRCEPAVRAIRFDGAVDARPSPAVLDILADGEVSAILIAPSNPYLSIDPILAVPGMIDAICRSAAPVIAVSPIVGGQAVKGPTAKLMGELGLAVSQATIAAHYEGIIDGLLIDRADPRAPLGLPHDETDTLMTTDADKQRVARAALALAERLR